MDVQAIIVASGSGIRFGSKKQFEPVSGRELLLHTLEPFEHLALITAITVIVPEGDLERTRIILQKRPRIAGILSGGGTRQESVGCGLDSLAPCDLVLIHDGVRPLVSPDLITRVVEAACEYGAAIPALPMSETVKEVSEEGRVLKTVDRRSLWSIQTPQGFRYELIRKGFQAARRDQFTGTDESMLLERIGIPVKVVQGEPENIKVTLPEDLRSVEAILKGKEGRGG